MDFDGDTSMPASGSEPHSLVGDMEDAITTLLFTIARRADELAQLRLFQTDLNAACWFKAEEEILGQHPIGSAGV